MSDEIFKYHVGDYVKCHVDGDWSDIVKLTIPTYYLSRSAYWTDHQTVVLQSEIIRYLTEDEKLIYILGQ
jgi:hypothetical protein